MGQMSTSDSKEGLVLSAYVPVKYYSEKSVEKFLLPSLFTAINCVCVCIYIHQKDKTSHHEYFVLLSSFLVR